MNAKLTASLLIAAAVLANVAFTALGSIFDYPDVLNEPASAVLADFRANETAVASWFTVLALSAALFAPSSNSRRTALTSTIETWAPRALTAWAQRVIDSASADAAREPGRRAPRRCSALVSTSQRSPATAGAMASDWTAALQRCSGAASDRRDGAGTRARTSAATIRTA